MDHTENFICKVCLCEFIEVKRFCKFSEEPLDSKEVIASCASVQLPKCVDSPEQVCSRCLNFEQNNVKIKTEYDEINIDDTFVNTCKSEQVDVKEEDEDFKCETLSVTFTDTNSVKTEYDDNPLGNPLRVSSNSINYKEFASLEPEENPTEKDKSIETHKCEVCNKQFEKKNRLTEHKKIHTGDRPFKCDKCKRHFTTSFSLKRHLQLHEPIRQEVYKCDVCHKELFSSGALKYHQKSHTGEKPYKCEVCYKYFYRSGELTRHQRGHTGEKPFKCDVCDKEFAVASNLKLHKQIHVITRVKLHKCDVCPKDFYMLAQLRKHQKTHTGEKPFKCNVCDREFNQMYNLKVHKQLHTQEQLYRCDVCCKNFYTARQLRNHQRTHTATGI